MKVLDRIALALVIIGALNWGAVGLFRFDCVAAIFGGQAAPISRVVYALVGLAGLWCITILFRDAIEYFHIYMTSIRLRLLLTVAFPREVEDMHKKFLRLPE